MVAHFVFFCFMKHANQETLIFKDCEEYANSTGLVFRSLREDFDGSTEYSKNIIAEFSFDKLFFGEPVATGPVESSTLAFRDALLGKTHREMEALGPDVRDTMIRNSIAIRIITFSNDAKEVWSNQSEERFEDMIVNLESEAMTNMGDALNKTT